MNYNIRHIIYCFIFLLSLIACRNENKVSGDDSVMMEIDLGLSVKWANMNIGASKPEEFGNYYALGCVTPFDSVPIYLEYPTDEEWHDSVGVVLPKYDAACYHTNNTWRIPTYEEWTELTDKCKWQWGNYNGVEGYFVEGPNGNSIFLPAAGNTESKYGDASNGGYRCSYVWDGGATFSLYFIKPQNASSPKISSELDALEQADVFWSPYGCQVPASIRAVKVEQ